jgi:ferric-dicitrate binding protein FerR (iron transport regulator)
MRRYVQFAAVVCAGLLLTITLPSAQAATDPGLCLATLSGSVSVNGHTQPAGQRAVGAGDLLESGAHSGVTILFGPGEVVSMDQDSAIRMLPGKNGPQIELERGRLQVSSSHNRLQDVRLAGRTMAVETESGRTSKYLVTRLPQGDFVYARLGGVSLREDALGVTTAVPEGKVAVIGSEPGSAGAPPQGGGDHAGKVAASVPKGYIMRASQKMDEKPGDDVIWNDAIVTEAGGRSRVTLDDGSILSVGSNSNLKVVQHDANAQQTQLELTSGKIRAQVNKISKAGGSFTVKTPTAVAGVVGTDFYIETDGKKTRVTVLEGIVKLTPIAAAVAVSIAAGQTSVAAGSSASTPAAASASQMSDATSSTSVSSAASAGAAGAASLPTVAVVAIAVVPAAVTAAVVPNIGQGNAPVSPTTPGAR